MSECIFRDTGIKCLIFVKEKGPDKNLEKNQGGKGKKDVKHSKEVLLVTKDGASYADLLKQVKNQIVDIKDVNSVNRIRKTNRGDLLIEAESEDIRHLNNNLKNTLEGATVKILGQGINRLKVQITDMDADITKEALLPMINGTVDEKAKVVVESVRPAYGETKTAIISLEREQGLELLKKDRIKLGVISCRIREFIAVKRCYRCWSLDHTALTCKGPDRSNSCLKCGKNGHKVANCTHDSFCPLCGRAGHRAGSGSCPKTRLMLSKIRKKGGLAAKKKKGA